MARLFVDGDDLVVHLSCVEKAAARRGDVRVPLTAVCRVTVEPDWWRALRGVPQRGVWVPGTRCIGMRSHHAGMDFVAIRSGRPVVCVELRPAAPLRLLGVSVPTRTEARSTVDWLGRTAPKIDTSTPWRQPLPVPEENSAPATSCTSPTPEITSPPCVRTARARGPDFRVRPRSVGGVGASLPPWDYVHRLTKGVQMSAIKESVDISCRPEDVFSYVTDPSHLPEWQESAVSVRPVGDAPVAVGLRVVVTRRIGRRDIPMTSEVTELDPPRSWRVDGIDGPIRGHVKGTIEPLGDGERSRLTLSLDFETHGIGKVLVPLVVRPHVRKEMPRNEQTLKRLLEGSA